MEPMGDKCSCGRRMIAGQCPNCSEKAKLTREQRRLKKEEDATKQAAQQIEEGRKAPRKYSDAKPLLRKGIAEQIIDEEEAEDDDDDF